MYFSNNYIENTMYFYDFDFMILLHYLASAP